jgi:hypothetical protein
LVLSLWFPELPFQLAYNRDGRLSGRPLAFLSPHGSTPVLWLVNRQAKNEGIVAGDSMDAALRRCPGLEVLDPAPQLWWDAQAGFGEFLSRWTPQGALGRMGEALLELHGTQRLYGHPKDAANRMLSELNTSMGWSSHGGLSGSGTAARLAARKEHGIEHVQSGFEASFIAPHSIKALPNVERDTLGRLQRLGLYQIRDLQPVPLNVLINVVRQDKAKSLLQCARGEDRPRLPMLADSPHESRHSWRIEPPAVPKEVPLASWLLDKLWRDKRCPRAISLNWWDIDGMNHRWSAGECDLLETPMTIARTAESNFQRESERRIVVHRLEVLIAWGLGRPKSLFGTTDRKLEAIEPALAKLRKRFPDHPVLPGWAASSFQGL